MNTPKTLADRIAESGSASAMLRNAQTGPFVFPLAAEYSNWRSEQEAWRTGVVFQDMSYHMTDVEFVGPDIRDVLARFGINSFANFGPMQAKQYVACNDDGQVIGDAILFGEAEDRVSVVGKPSVANWLKFNLAGTKTKVTADDRPSPRMSDRRRFRFQVQGPLAQRLMETATAGTLPDLPFFRMGSFRVGNVQVTALNHRMSGAPGYEFWGDAKDAETVRSTIFEIGRPLGLTPVGGKCYPITAQEFGLVRVTVARDLHRPAARRVSPMASGGQLRGQAVRRRKPCCRRSLGRVPHAGRPWIRVYGEVRPRVRGTRGH